MKKNISTSINEKLIIDGNAFYELDLDCVEKHKTADARRKKNSTPSFNPEKRQRK